MPSDVLNRYPNSNNREHTIHVMKYIFPRQFGLHNVFTFTVDPKETVQPFKDYTLREQEITQRERQAMQKRDASAPNSVAVNQWLPRRLRGKTLDLVRKLQNLHSRCSYHELLQYYCPVKVSIRMLSLLIDATY